MVLFKAEGTGHINGAILSKAHEVQDENNSKSAPYIFYSSKNADYNFL